jgi:hypothetical protein
VKDRCPEGRSPTRGETPSTTTEFDEVEGVWLESESSPFGELLAESAWKILESFGKVAIVGPAET